MKKLTVLSLVLILFSLTLILASCDFKGESQSETEAPTNEPTETERDTESEEESTQMSEELKSASKITRGMTYDEAVEMLGREGEFTEDGRCQWHLSDGSILEVIFKAGEDDSKIIGHPFIYTISDTGVNRPESINDVRTITLVSSGWMLLDLDLQKDSAEIQKIIEHIGKLNGAPTQSTRGYYGEDYAVHIVMKNGQTFELHLIGANMYYTNEYEDSDGYNLAVFGDASEFLDYLSKNFPEDMFDGHIIENEEIATD